MNLHRTAQRIIRIFLLLTFTTTTFAQSTTPYYSLTIEERARVDAQLDFTNLVFREMVSVKQIVPKYRIRILINEHKSKDQILKYKTAYLVEFQMIYKKTVGSPIMGRILCIVLLVGFIYIFNEGFSIKPQSSGGGRLF